MSMPVTGVVLLAIILFFFAVHPRRLAHVVVFFAPFTATAVININAIPLGISPSFVAVAFLLLSWVVYGFAMQGYAVGKDHALQFVSLGLFTFSVVLSLAWNIVVYGNTTAIVTQSMYLLIGLVTTLVLSLEFTRPGQLELALKAARLSSTFVCFWAIVQGVCFYAHIPYPAVVFNNSVSKSADMFAQELGAIVRLASVAVEPSVMVFSLLHFLAFGLTVVVLNPDMRTRTWMVPTAIAGLLILASTSSTGYLGVLLLLALLGLRRPVQVLLGSIPPVILGAFALFVFPQFRRILWDVTFNKTGSYSYMVRMQDVHDAFESFYSHPLFGAGWGSVTPSDLFGTILGNSGVVGLLAYAIAVIATLISLHATSRSALVAGDRKLSTYAVGVQNAIIVCLGCSSASGLKYYFLDDWCYWAIAIALSSQTVLRTRAVAKVAARPSTQLVHRTARIAG